jgi:hypothetical protein
MIQTSPTLTLRRTSLKFGMIALCAGLAAVMAQAADARPGGGGFRGGGFSGLRGGPGLSRPSGANLGSRNIQRPNGQQAQGAGQRFGKNGQQAKPQQGAANAQASNSGNKSTRTAAGNGNTSTTSRGNGNQVAANRGVARSGNGNGNGNTGVVNNGNTGVVNNGNIGSGNVNTGNVVAGNDVDVDVNGGWYGGYAGTGAAYATGVAVGATTTAVTTSAATAAAVGSYYSALPAGCSPYVWGGYSYYSCYGTWYRQTYQSGSTVYVVVSDPTKK